MDIIDKLVLNRNLLDEQFIELLTTDEYDEKLFVNADRVRREWYGDEVYIRGLIEFTNNCKNNCYYCGIRRDNPDISRYRLTTEEIIHSCERAYKNGIRTFVLQGGEDPYYTDDRVCEIISGIRKQYCDCAITLSIGEKSRESYKAYFESGANRYLLRQETASSSHYIKLHPNEMKLETRKQCLFDLKEIGYQVGAGFMVGSPFQSMENIVEDIRFMQKLDPDMIGIGPFISHTNTPFKEYENGSLKLTLRLIAVLRLIFPHALIPATTALGTIHPKGRELGLKSGANVLMPNVSPYEAREKYVLYNNKVCVYEEFEKHLEDMKEFVENSGYRIVTSIGNVKKENK